MRLPARLTHQHPLRKVIAALLIAGLATAMGVALHSLAGLRVAMAGLDDTLYDAFYRFRKPEDRAGGPVVIVTVDEGTMESMAKKKRHWPFPRTVWADSIRFLEQSGARAIVFDVIFQEPADFDKEFGQAIDAARTPVVLGANINPDGKPAAFAPKVSRPPAFGAVNILSDRVIRDYKPSVHGVPSLAIRAVQQAGASVPEWAAAPFRLHYYGPTELKDGRRTYRYVPAFNIFVAAQQPSRAAELGVPPELFRGKIVMIGSTALGTYDLKSSPLSGLYPGVEAQATAVDNLLGGQHVHKASWAVSAMLTFFASWLAALGVMMPRKVTLKVLCAIAAAALLTGLAVEGFTGEAIRWLPLASPLVAMLMTVVVAFAFSYFTEDRQRRLVLKALSQYVSPEVAAEVERNPSSLKLGGQRREMTVMFTDIAGFTDISESMDSEKLSEMLNFYLGEMSALILDRNGTLDKYIGDAIMSFWNAPILQADHAAMACRAALAMRDREAQIQEELRALGAPGLMTRIGINTGPMVFGNMGSPHKFNYTVLGDSVNLGSRLEGANKFYGSRILLAQTTAERVKDRFVLRHLDLLRVKGKQKPLAVYELIAEGTADEPMRTRINQYEQALDAYSRQRWDDAEAILWPLHEHHADDGPVNALLKRIAKLRFDPPPADWDGVYVAKDK